DRIDDVLSCSKMLVAIGLRLDIQEPLEIVRDREGARVVSRPIDPGLESERLRRVPERLEKVDLGIEVVGLAHIQREIVGDAGVPEEIDKLSGVAGEQRRLELIHQFRMVSKPLRRRLRSLAEDTGILRERIDERLERRLARLAADLLHDVEGRKPCILFRKRTDRKGSDQQRRRKEQRKQE